MAGDHQAEGAPEAVLDRSDLRIAVVSARWNSHITLRLLDGVRRGLADAGVPEANITESWVPGAFELPLHHRGTPALWGGVEHAVVCLGCVVRGETTLSTVAGQCASGIQHAQLETGVPIALAPSP